MVFEPIPNTPIANAGLLYVSGLQVSNAVVASAIVGNLLTIGAGQCRDSQDITDILLQAPVNVNPNVVGPNGLDQGVFATNKWYAVYVIASSNYPPQDAAAYAITNPQSPPLPADPYPPVGLISLSPNAPLLPFGYDCFRRVGWANTIGNSGPVLFNIFWQFNSNSQTRVYVYDAAIPTASTAASPSGYSDLLLTSNDLDTGGYLLMPPLATMAQFVVEYAPAVAGTSVSFQVFGSSNSSAFVAQVGNPVMAVPIWQNVSLPVELDSSGIPAIKYQTADSDNLHLYIAGFVDLL